MRVLADVNLVLQLQRLAVEEPDLVTLLVADVNFAVRGSTVSPARKTAGVFGSGLIDLAAVAFPSA